MAWSPGLDDSTQLRVCDRWRSHFSSVASSQDTHYSLDFFNLISSHVDLCLQLWPLYAPFSAPELAQALAQCHDSAPGHDGLPHSAFNPDLPWWRGMLLQFFNLVLHWNGAGGVEDHSEGLQHVLGRSYPCPPLPGWCDWWDVAHHRELPLWHSFPGSDWFRRLPPWVDSGIAQGRVLSPLLFNLLVNSLVATISRASPGVRLSSCSDFRLSNQFFADDLVILQESAADLQAALDAVSHWGQQWRFSFGIGPEKSAVVIFSPPRHALTCEVYLKATFCLSSLYRYLGVVLTPTLSWCNHVDHLVDRGRRLFAQCVSWVRSEGLPVSFLLFLLSTYVLPSASFVSNSRANAP